MHHSDEPSFVLSVTPHKAALRSPKEPSLLQVEQVRFSQLFLTLQVLQPGMVFTGV